MWLRLTYPNIVRPFFDSSAELLRNGVPFQTRLASKLNPGSPLSLGDIPMVFYLYFVIVHAKLLPKRRDDVAPTFPGKMCPGLVSL